jgi:hypothetical protein
MPDGSGGAVIYLDGGKDLDMILSKVKFAGGSVALKKTFLGDQAVLSLSCGPVDPSALGPPDHAWFQTQFSQNNL